MRTTVDLPPDLHSVMHSLASSQRCSLSKVAVELMRRGLEAQSAGLAGLAGAAAPTLSPDTGLPLVRFPRIVSSEDVRALDVSAGLKLLDFSRSGHAGLLRPFSSIASSSNDLLRVDLLDCGASAVD